MLQLIIQYKDILFGGLGTGIILFVLGKMWLDKVQSQKVRQSQSGGAGSVNLQSGGDINIGDKR